MRADVNNPFYDEDQQPLPPRLDRVKDPITVVYYWILIFKIAANIVRDKLVFLALVSPLSVLRHSKTLFVFPKYRIFIFI